MIRHRDRGGVVTPDGIHTFPLEDVVAALKKGGYEVFPEEQLVEVEGFVEQSYLDMHESHLARVDVIDYIRRTEDRALSASLTRRIEDKLRQNVVRVDVEGPRNFERSIRSSVRVRMWVERREDALRRMRSAYGSRHGIDVDTGEALYVDLPHTEENR